MKRAQPTAARNDETEAVERNREYAALLKEVTDNPGLREELAAALHDETRFGEIAEMFSEFHAEFEQHAFNYKIRKNSDDIIRLRRIRANAAEMQKSFAEIHGTLL